MSRTCFSLAVALATALAAAVPAGAQTAAPTPAPTQAPTQPPVQAASTPAAPAAGTPISAAAQSAPTATPVAAAAAAATVATPPNIPAGIKPPADYVIGVDDSLDIVYWQDKEMSANVVVRPDGNISLPLVNDIKAAGLTPEELRASVAQAATKFVEDPTVSVVVKAINSRKVFLLGQVAKPGPYALMDATSVLQMLATAGGVNEYAKTEKITIVRKENGKEVVRRFNYKDVSQGKSMEQNIALKPGDTIIVP